MDVVGYPLDSSPIGSWPSNPSFNWRIQRSVEGFSQAARVFLAQVGSPGPSTRPAPKGVLERGHKNDPLYTQQLTNGATPYERPHLFCSLLS